MVTASRGPNWVRALLVPLTILSWLALLIVTAWLLSHVAHALLLLVLAGLLALPPTRSSTGWSGSCPG